RVKPPTQANPTHAQPASIRFEDDHRASSNRFPEFFLIAAHRAGAIRSGEDRMPAPKRKKILLIFSGRERAAANFGRIAWPLRWRSVAILSVFARHFRNRAAQ